MQAMKLIAQFHRIVDALCKLPAVQIPDAEFANADGWLDDEQWLAGLPADVQPPAVWGWWRAQ